MSLRPWMGSSTAGSPGLSGHFLALGLKCQVFITSPLKQGSPDSTHRQQMILSGRSLRQVAIEYHVCHIPLSILSSTAAAAKLLQSCPTLCDPIVWQPTRLPSPWDSPGKNTGVGCHFLLQCMKVKSESDVTQSCPTLCDPKDCSLSCSSVHGIF